jgi:hypothetical protein
MVVSRGDAGVVEWWPAAIVERDLTPEAERLGALAPEHMPWWADGFGGAPSDVLLLRDASGMPRTMWGVARHRSRALPGHQLLHLRRAAVPSMPDLEAMLDGLAVMTRGRRRVLSIRLRFHAATPADWSALEATMRRRGWRRPSHGMDYAWTGLVDVGHPDDVLLARLDARGRRQVRRAEREAVCVRPLVDPRQSGRLDLLAATSFGRSGGVLERRRWDRWIALAAAHPEALRIAGAFLGPVEDPASLVGFACGIRQGDVVVYEVAGSSPSDGVNLPVLHPVVWDLMRWTRDVGGRWLDLGGMPAPGADPAAFRGIIDFKRQFNPVVAQVASEWISDVASARARLQRGLGALARRLDPARRRAGGARATP